jgi:aspartate/methionine/tyrosine aminotransferase
MTLKLSRRGQVPPFYAMEMLRAANERAATGADVLHLEVGQPSTAAPSGVIRAAQAALASGAALGYTEALGIPPLRAAIASLYRDWYGIEVSPDQVIATPGSSGGFVLAFLAAFDAGDRVGMTAPGYPAYRSILRALGLVPVEIPVGPEQQYRLTPDVLAQAGSLDGLIIASPANPTGTMLSRDELAGIVRHCRGNGIRLISDEIYHGLTYDARAATVLEATQDAIVINGFSKYFSMTGWRLGWMIAPAELVRPIECLAQSMFISPPTLSQHAALGAFECMDELEANRRRYAENRALLLEELPKAGIDRFAPADGAFYIYADVGRLTNDTQAFCRLMLAETGVACTPGIDFDTAQGSRTIRLSFAGRTAEIAEAAKRLKDWRRR